MLQEIVDEVIFQLESISGLNCEFHSGEADNLSEFAVKFPCAFVEISGGVNGNMLSGSGTASLTLSVFLAGRHLPMDDSCSVYPLIESITSRIDRKKFFGKKFELEKFLPYGNNRRGTAVFRIDFTSVN